MSYRTNTRLLISLSLVVVLASLPLCHNAAIKQWIPNKTCREDELGTNYSGTASFPDCIPWKTIPWSDQLKLVDSLDDAGSFCRSPIIGQQRDQLVCLSKLDGLQVTFKDCSHLVPLCSAAHENEDNDKEDDFEEQAESIWQERSLTEHEGSYWKVYMDQKGNEKHEVELRIRGDDSTSGPTFLGKIPKDAPIYNHVKDMLQSVQVGEPLEPNATRVIRAEMIRRLKKVPPKRQLLPEPTYSTRKQVRKILVERKPEKPIYTKSSFQGPYECEAGYDKFENHTMCMTSSEVCEFVLPTSRKLSQKAKNVAVDSHNKLRSLVAKGTTSPVGSVGPAMNMLKLKWDDELAAIAQAWANQCLDLEGATYGGRVNVNPHDQERSTIDGIHVGQNVYFTWSTNMTPRKDSDLLENAAKSWYDEINDLPDRKILQSFRTVSGPPVGHFTQIVWADTSYIGCGVSHFLCKGGDPDEEMGTCGLVVCNYKRGGNIISRPLFKESDEPECSDDTELEEETGLCVYSKGSEDGN